MLRFISTLLRVFYRRPLFAWILPSPVAPTPTYGRKVGCRQRIYLGPYIQPRRSPSDDYGPR